MIVIDTHVWIWLCSDPSKLSANAARAVRDADRIGISSFSVLEAARLVRAGRIRMQGDGAIQRALRFDARAEEIPMNSVIAEGAVALLDRGLGGDPADQVIVATAEVHRAKVVTKDRVLREFSPEGTLW